MNASRVGTRRIFGQASPWSPQRAARLRTVLWAASVVTLLSLAALPPAMAAVGRSVPASSCDLAGGCTVPALSANASAPLYGLVTNCSSASRCDFVFNSTAPTGWANASPPSMSLRLPGEALTSVGLSYSTYTASLTGTYTYWTVGTFVGTDVNTGKVVYGTTNTNYTITCHGHSGRGGGCTYTYTTDNGTIVVFFTQAEQTTTVAACAPSTIGPGSSTVCTATVNDTWNASAVPSGNVSFSGSFGSTANFSNGGSCTLASGTCSVSYTAPDELLGTVSIAAAFAGTVAFYASSGRTSIYVSSTVGGGGDPFSNVNFGETGLANGTLWTVTLGGLTLSSSNSSVPFQVQNGTYPFTIAPVAGYVLSLPVGNVTVAGDDVNVNVTFSVVAFPLTFNTTGLPIGKWWSVNLDGISFWSSQPTLSINATNGTHAYRISGPAGFRVTGLGPSGNLTVTGAPVTVPFSFVRAPTYAIVFAEKGLPRNATWCVDLGTLACSSTHSLRFANLTPATYSYDVVPMSGQVISARMGTLTVNLTGNLVLTNHSLRLVLHYTYPYAVTFTETGLPGGTNWTVTIGGVTHASINGTITFELGNGSHAYRIGPVVGYLHSGTPTAARVVGGPAAVLVTFRT